MENLFDDDDLPLDDSCDPIKEEQYTNVLPTLQLDTSLNKNIKTDDEDESIDICSTEALLEIVNENPTTLVPRVFPGPMEERLTETSMLEFFSTPGTHFMHIQMPNAMPGLDKDRTLKWKPTANRDIYKPKQTDQAPPIQTTQEPLSYNTSHLASLPSGKLGRIRIHKSGKVRLHIGNHVFNFAQGNRMTCKQQVGCLLEENNEFLFLGNYHKKFVVSPDISTMWKQQE